MACIHIQTDIHAPVERVFDLARSIDAHVASAGRSSERAIAGRTSGLLELDETVTWEATHFGIRQRLTVRMVELQSPHRFEDKMVSGPFASMRHIHEFHSHEGGTRMQDEFHFNAPLGILGRCAERLFLTRHLRRFLTTRNQELKAMAESDAWRAFLPEPNA